MEIETSLPRPVREIAHIEIAMSDGTRLAARIWMPEDADTAPVPVIFEYIPYRKNDKTLERDHARAPYMASRGYAYVRLDIRGTGESEGVMTDEYTEQELADGVEAIAWIAAQDWCDGNVGIVGISWGGFNGLQIAALRPPALKAVVSICSTDDRYADDVHYMGGTMLIDQISWAGVMFGINTLPPDPAHVGDRWRSMWMDRLKGSGLWLSAWMRHQTRDAYWRHGSICENYDDIEIPVYAVSGWADGYCRAVFRLVENLKAPCKGIVGPWAHSYPYMAEPGPAINWLEEELRWWDHWLKGRDTGIMDEPRLSLFMQDHAAPKSHYSHRPGRWVSEPTWPSPNIRRTDFGLCSDGRLFFGGPAASTGDGPGCNIASPYWVGLGGGKWCSYANPGDQPVDQRRDDAGSLVFETAPLRDPLEIVGDANLRLRLSADRPLGLVAARLMDVAPDGAASRVSYALLNLAHRNGHAAPDPMTPGAVFTVTVPFKTVAQTFRAGHRIRLAISTTYFPLCWPSPEPVCLTVFPESSTLSLPLRMGDKAPAPSFDGPRSGLPLAVAVESAPRYAWRVTEDVAHDRVHIEIHEHEGDKTIQDQDLRVFGDGRERYETGPDPLSTVGRTSWTHEFSRDDWAIRTETDTRVTCTASEFHITACLRAWDGETLVHEEHWTDTIPRDHL